MDIATELKAAKERQQGLVAQFNNVKQQQAELQQTEQQLLQELLKLEGEIRLLHRLSKDGGTPDGQQPTD